MNRKKILIPLIGVVVVVAVILALLKFNLLNLNVIEFKNNEIQFVKIETTMLSKNGLLSKVEAYINLENDFKYLIIYNSENIKEIILISKNEGCIALSSNNLTCMKFNKSLNLTKIDIEKYFKEGKFLDKLKKVYQLFGETNLSINKVEKDGKIIWFINSSNFTEKIIFTKISRDEFYKKYNTILQNYKKEYLNNYSNSLIGTINSTKLTDFIVLLGSFGLGETLRRINYNNINKNYNNNI